MTDVLGLELERAREELAREGYEVTCVSTASRKGVDGNEARVIRVRRTGDVAPDAKPCLELVYSVFRTDVDHVCASTERKRDELSGAAKT